MDEQVYRAQGHEGKLTKSYSWMLVAMEFNKGRIDGAEQKMMMKNNLCLV